MGGARKQPRLSEDEVLQKLLDSLINKEEIKTTGLEELIKNTNNPNDAIELVKKLDKLTNCSKSNILMWAYQQCKVFQKLKMNGKFVSTDGVSKTTINFKIDIVNFIETYPKMKKSCISPFYLKNNFPVIKNVCQEHASEFQKFSNFCLIFFVILELAHFKPVFFL